MSRKGANEGSGRPDWRLPALRTGLEVALVALVATYLAIHLSSPLLVGLVAVAGVVGAVALFFRALDRQAYAWVRYASRRAQESQRERRRERERRKRRQRSRDRQPRQSSNGDSKR